ncbi:hypothetical protein [Tumebacillus flagellatus]|uniref:DUF3829 domain-containing protein n=1 Tax=Tumebacillus flagellatus TaxID=1157490 RepID=A0A074LL49_9BACL|nr:hypothetical protein [Tumebacillus flagellatus]KEO81829.1 hypothetical protein EL26_18480 [Tumebacillus flagellatus]
MSKKTWIITLAAVSVLLSAGCSASTSGKAATDEERQQEYTLYHQWWIGTMSSEASIQNYAKGVLPLLDESSSVKKGWTEAANSYQKLIEENRAESRKLSPELKAVHDKYADYLKQEMDYYKTQAKSNTHHGKEILSDLTSHYKNDAAAEAKLYMDADKQYVNEHRLQDTASVPRGAAVLDKDRDYEWQVYQQAMIPIRLKDVKPGLVAGVNGKDDPANGNFDMEISALGPAYQELYTKVKAESKNLSPELKKINDEYAKYFKFQADFYKRAKITKNNDKDLLLFGSHGKDAAMMNRAYLRDLNLYLTTYQL